MAKDIALAYQEENRYYKDKDTLHSNTLNILDYIGKAGYDNYEDYYSDLQEYLLKTQDYEIVEPVDIAEDVYMENINKQKPAFFYLINSSNNYAFVPLNFENDEIFDEYGIIPAHMTYLTNNGVIITSDGDLRIVLITPEIDIPLGYFLSKLENFLSLYFDDVRVDNNDILIDNKKVCGSGFIRMNSMNIYMFQITFVDRSDLIKKICTNSVKEPGHINSDVLSQYKLKDEFLSWLRL